MQKRGKDERKKKDWEGDGVDGRGENDATIHGDTQKSMRL